MLFALLYALWPPPAHAAPGAAVGADLEAPPVTWGATDARYTVTIPAEGPLLVTLEWTLAGTTPAWAELPLAGSGLVVRSATGPVVAGPAGLFALVPPSAARGGATIRVTGTLDPTGQGAASLRVLPAARQRVIVDAPGLDVTVAGAHDGWLAAADTLALTWAPRVTTEAPPRPATPVVHAEAATAVWAEPGALISQTVARWKVVRGAVERFELDVAGLEEVEVEAAGLLRTERAGDRLVLSTRAPVKGTFEARIRARKAVSGDGEVPAPAPRPVASRVSRYFTVGGAEDGELVPTGGPRAVPARAIPEWGRGLSETAVVSAWQGDTPLRVRLANYAPMMGPETVIERAVLVVAAAAEGRALLRTTWHVRNERKQYLHVVPQDGARPMTARVSGEAVLVLSDGTGGVYVPLEKSVETVQGLLTFPVELTWIAEGEAWARKGERAFELPAVDAPIQAAEWEVYLPRGVTAKGAVSAAPPPEEEAGAAALQQAVAAYKRNDFTTSSALLETVRSSGSTNANVDRLQSNLDVLLDDAKDKGGEASVEDDEEAEDVATRRVRALANAKTITLQVEQEKKAEEAKLAYASGDVERAEAYLEDVIALADDIGVTEQKESQEQDQRRDDAKRLLGEVKKQKAASGKASAEGGARPADDGEDRDANGPVAGFELEEVAPYGDELAEPVEAPAKVDASAPPPEAPAPVRATRAPAAKPAPLRTPPPPPPPPAAAVVALPVLTRPTTASTTAPPAPESRAALDVRAAPLTLAMPLGGDVVRVTNALLPAGVAPTLTLPYRTTGDPR